MRRAPSLPTHERAISGRRLRTIGPRSALDQAASMSAPFCPLTGARLSVVLEKLSPSLAVPDS
jgi:hypothetical protein